MRIYVRVNTLDDLAGDMRGIAVSAKPKLAKVVRSNAIDGNRLAKTIADSKAGIHGRTYSKRLSAEMIAPLSWEYGPEGTPKTEFVGVGFRHGVNLDLPQSADVIGPAFAHDVGKEAGAGSGENAMSEESQLAAVVTKLRDGGSNAYSLAGLKALSALPAYYTEVQVSTIYAERTRGETPDVRLWRIVTRAVALNYVNAQREREKARAALEGQLLTVDGKDTTRIQYDQSDDGIGPDEDRFSGISMYRYAH